MPSHVDSETKLSCQAYTSILTNSPHKHSTRHLHIPTYITLQPTCKPLPSSSPNTIYLTTLNSTYHRPPTISYPTTHTRKHTTTVRPSSRCTYCHCQHHIWKDEKGVPAVIREGKWGICDECYRGVDRGCAKAFWCLFK